MTRHKLVRALVIGASLAPWAALVVVWVVHDWLKERRETAAAIRAEEEADRQ